MFENVKTNLRKLKWVILDDGNRLLLQSFLLQIFQLHLEPQLGLEDVCGLALHLNHTMLGRSQSEQGNFRTESHIEIDDFDLFKLK